MPRFLIHSLLALALVNACQTESPNIQPSPNDPFPHPEPTPSGSYPYLDIFEKSNADVTQREVFLNIDQARLSPDRSKVLYTFQTTQRARFENTSRPIAERRQDSGLWLYDASTQQHRELKKGTDQYPSSRDIASSTWWGSQDLLYIDHDKDRLQRLKLQTGQEETVFNAFIRDFQVKDEYVFILYLDKDTKNVFVQRLHRTTGERLTVEIPNTDFYTQGQSFQVLSHEFVLLGQFKDSQKEGAYPFKVATTSPPPLQDSFLLNLSTQALTPLEKGLDLSAYEQIEMSADQQYFATHRRNNTQIYTQTGTLLWESPGSFSWLSTQEIMVHNGRQLSRLRLTDNSASLVETRNTQTACSPIQGSNPILMECPVDNATYSTDYGLPQTRVFRYFPMQEIPAFQTGGTENTDPGLRSQSLLTAESGQPVRLVEQSIPAPQESRSSQAGYTSLSILNETGELIPLFHLNFPEANFVFDPRENTWMQIL